jgi:hypothetical protein
MKNILLLLALIISSTFFQSCTPEPKVEKIYVNSKGEEIAVPKNSIIHNDEVIGTKLGGKYSMEINHVLYRGHIYIEVLQYDRYGLTHDPDCTSPKHTGE